MKFSNLHRIYINVPLTQNKSLYLDSKYVSYLSTVLRLKIGGQFRIFNEIDGEFITQIIEIQKKYLIIEIKQFLRKPNFLPSLCLGLSVIKLNKMFDALMMAVQLGVTEITPLLTDRSQIRDINIERLSRCVIEATEQAELFAPPQIHSPLPIEEYNNFQNCDLIIYANEKEEVKNSINTISIFPEKIALIIGPEGGFSEEEFMMFKRWDKAHSISLGSTVLRTETAVAAALAQIILIRNKNA